MPVCPACKQSIIQAQPTLRLSPGQLTLGKKSGQLYHQATFEEDILIHYGCVFYYFNPFADKEMYDIFYERLETQVKEEQLDELKEEAYSQVADDVKSLCPECKRDRCVTDGDTEYECDNCRSMELPTCPSCAVVPAFVIECMGEPLE